jgi:hypothetical protein
VVVVAARGLVSWGHQAGNRNDHKACPGACQQPAPAGAASCHQLVNIVVEAILN